MATPPPGCRGYRGEDQLHQPGRGVEGLLGASRDYPLGNPISEALLAVRSQDPGKLRGTVGVEDLCSRGSGTAHSHVERSVDRVGEAALQIIDLQRRQPEIQEDALYCRQA
jgi:hypothetical protein